MAIELTTATTAELSGIRQSLGTALHWVEVLFPNASISIDGNGVVAIPQSGGVVDFKFFERYKAFGFLFNRGISTILNANVLTNLENQGTASALTLSNNSLSKAAIDQLFTVLPTTTKTATIDVSTNPGAATCDTTIATNKGYTVITE